MATLKRDIHRALHQELAELTAENAKMRTKLDVLERMRFASEVTHKMIENMYQACRVLAREVLVFPALSRKGREALLVAKDYFDELGMPPPPELRRIPAARRKKRAKKKTKV